MERLAKGQAITIEWSIFREDRTENGGKVEKFDEKNLKIYRHGPRGEVTETTDYKILSETEYPLSKPNPQRPTLGMFVLKFYPKDQTSLGTYYFRLVENEGKQNAVFAETCRFKIVASPSQEDGGSCVSDRVLRCQSRIKNNSALINKKYY